MAAVVRMAALCCGAGLFDRIVGALMITCWAALLPRSAVQAASPHQPQPPSSWILATVNLTKLQPEDIFRKPAYRRHLLQDSSAGISSGDSSSFDAGGNNNNAGAQCSGTGNLCQNTPTTVNNNQAITVYQYLPPSASAQPGGSTSLRGNQCGASAVNIQGNTFIIYKHADTACGCARVCAADARCKVWCDPAIICLGRSFCRRVYCSNQAGCGSGCRAYQERNKYSPQLPCSTTDAWPYQFCTLKSSNLGTANGDYYGWISGTSS